MKKKIKVVFILDETGSMMCCKGVTISGFNEYVKALKGKKSNTVMSLTTFNSDKVNRRNDESPINEIKDLTDKNYDPSACTPLYDAIGQTIRGVKKGKNEEVVCVIMTDGMENASREFTLEGINILMREKEKEGWTFVYLGADHDSWNVGQSFGMSPQNVSNYGKGQTAAAFGVLAKNTTSYSAQTRTFFSGSDKTAMNKGSDDEAGVSAT